MSDIIERAKYCFDQLHADLVAEVERLRSHKSLPPGMVWQDYYSPDDACKIREPLDDEIERLRAELDRLRPREIHTVAELDALSARVIVRAGEEIWEKLSTGAWDCLSEDGTARPYPWTPLPALVLWTPEAQ